VSPVPAATERHVAVLLETLADDGARQMGGRRENRVCRYKCERLKKKRQGGAPPESIPDRSRAYAYADVLSWSIRGIVVITTIT
jgi:hypothetical protein